MQLSKLEIVTEKPKLGDTINICMYLVLIEEFKWCIHSDVRTFINDQKAGTLEDAAQLAVEFSLSHGVNFMEKPCQLHTPSGRVLPPSVPGWLWKPQKLAE
ncbi:hypothetical protein pdam_00024358 [Pocillopora damicornis]|uniref:Uncharacterized protein n=1 Tax=Pocillopora damicornis TaxID=46731 RepID=A0A3M6U268_POCDA|nr:hypothetical protein pdam_00024358 [Pocillopora damicornis]